MNKGVVMSFKKDNECSICTLFYSAHVFDKTKKVCIFCESEDDSPGKPTCYMCKKSFSKENPAYRIYTDNEERIVHKDCKNI